MENETERDEEVEETEEEEATNEESESDKEEPTKKEESPSAKKARLDRMSDQHDKKHGLGKYAEKVEKSSNRSDGLDYGQKAYLVAKGVEHSDDIKLVETAMAETGNDLETVLGSKFVQGELKAAKEFRKTEQGTPKSAPRRGKGSQNSEVDFWVAKGTLPENKPENLQLRRDVVNARQKLDGESSKFTTQPVVSG